MSLDNMDSSDSGGVGAKKGFLYQDHAAAYFVTMMLRDKRLQGVCCEVIDDIDLIYDDYIEYIQLKSTDGDKKWTPDELCKRTKESGHKRYNDNSIVHKSMDTDSIQTKSKFRIITIRGVNKDLLYLTISLTNRVKKEGRVGLLDKLSKKIKEYKSPNGNGIDYWVDHCEWEVVPSIETFEQRSKQNIRQAAAADGYYIDSIFGEETILNGILRKVTNLSAKTKKTNLSVDKTYFRKDLIIWIREQFDNLVKINPTLKKVYSRDIKSLPQILLPLISQKYKGQENKICDGLYQSYNAKKYRFEFIAENLFHWLPELLLRPEELASISSTNVIEKIKKMFDSIDNAKEDLENLTKKSLLHSLLRTKNKSQPVLASLYLEKDGASMTFDNIHIIKHDNQPDELWLGLSYLINDDNTQLTVNDIHEKLKNFIHLKSDKEREIILDIKSDDYLVDHDVNQILEIKESLDDHISRFRFIIFIGYKTDKQKIAYSDGYIDDIKKEVTDEFINLLDNLLIKDDYYDDLNFNIYIYPIPCIDTLINTLKIKIQGEKNGSK
ncbi:dsDNA nuclease domain-containing protein [Yersinia enterocolitica]|uniref:HamA C-terminal domain-containing protein n=1 Tax=Yersinia enterocolitica TaxID=630 RepID=UPI0025AB2FFD|nr:dsDNA nuclease domain-containing protein [Yersinia enterocolitica]MDN0101209.1 dsDNA nuclease domain-containing protein [Yersinia enterocolitica]HDL7126764.1 DUF4297 domain-containing protein [Yersinia enterocolitica]HDL7210624.1 DUF4297 domain-containing protein [Yersinia enterocolitica]HDL7214853.1 DUF4297 domain-containing protein [Yersinia enterocolitica]HEI6974928.1 DUF4297 domain-containing protein [Yersinia enterocolitica]